MKINPINNNRQISNAGQPNFNGAYKIRIPKELFLYDGGEAYAQGQFQKALDGGIKRMPKKLIDKVLGIFKPNQEAIMFFNYPGYENIQDNANIVQHGVDWVRQHINYTGLKLNIILPNAAPDDCYDFVVLTGEEKKTYIKLQKNASKRINEYFINLPEKLKVRLNPDDIKLWKKLLRLADQNASFVEAIGGVKIEGKEIENIEELPEAIDMILTGP